MSETAAGVGLLSGPLRGEEVLLGPAARFWRRLRRANANLPFVFACLRRASMVSWSLLSISSGSILIAVEEKRQKGRMVNEMKKESWGVDSGSSEI